jgi:hypothetical protein
MMNTIDLATFRELLKTEFPRLLREHPESRHELFGIILEAYPSREETHVLFEELRTAQQETNQRLGELEYRMETGFEAARQEREAGFEAARREREELRAEIQTLRQDTEAGFEAARQEREAGFQAIRKDMDRLGSRWGIRNESIFRQTIATLLEQSFGAQVQSLTIAGEEFDVIISNGEHILVEITASAGPKTQRNLERKRALYAQATKKTPSRVILATASIHSQRAEALRKAGFEVIEPEEEDLE